VEPSTNASDNLEALDYFNKPSTSYMRRPKYAKVEFNYQLTCDGERKTIKHTQRFGYANLNNYALTIVEEMNGSKLKAYRRLQKV